MKTTFLSAFVLISFLLACNSNPVVEPTKKPNRTARTIAPSNLGGWWRFQSYTQDAYPFPVVQNYSSYRTGCTLSTRWLYISPTGYNAYTYDGDGCYPGSLSAINSSTNYLVEYFVWGTFSGESPTYSFSSTGSNTGYFDLYRGSHGVVYSQSTVFNSGNSLQICPNNAGECYYYRRANQGESTPPLP